LLIGNGILVGLLQWIWGFLTSLLHTILSTLLLVPLQAFSGLFKQTIQNMSTFTSNPIVALATSGAQYINVCVNTWITLSITLAAYGMVPITSGIMTVILIVIAPLIFSWLGMIFAVGVLMAYFIPMIPYVLFTFGALGWMMGVIEAMVAAPIVALGVMLPEGHDVFGQGKDALMLILYAFLRPGMMILGYISGIILATVGIWMINTGSSQFFSTYLSDSGIAPTNGGSSITYEFAFIFLFFIYIGMCMMVIEQAFELIFRLPDGILRWIGGGTQEAFGAGVAGKALGQVKGEVEKGGKSLESGASQKRSFGEGGDSSSSKKGGNSAGGNTGGSDDTAINMGESVAKEAPK
jgi:defect-in-organelle-trafficking protein DotA